MTPPMPIRTLFALTLAAVPAAVQDEVELPKAARVFVAPGTKPIAYEVADLNRDGREDAILVLERQPAKPDDPPIEERQRPLLVLVRQRDGSLREAARNEQIVYCSTCGGIMGDPFIGGLQAGPGTFTVGAYGGSAWRWGVKYRFDYSRRDDEWQLVRVEEISFHYGDASEAKPTVSRPPKHFGKISLAAFDPDNWKGKGPK
jgi:hypothetical protein